MRSERSSVQTCLTSVWLQQYAQEFSLEREREAARGSGRPGRGQCIVRHFLYLVWVWPPVYRARREDSEKVGGEGGEIPAILYYEIQFLLFTLVTVLSSETEVTSSPDHCQLFLILVDGN